MLLCSARKPPPFRGALGFTPGLVPAVAKKITPVSRNRKASGNPAPTSRMTSLSPACSKWASNSAGVEIIFTRSSTFSLSASLRRSASSS
eukprot:scaffold142745_cov20-Tisochrysis_lutea.AAC.1